MKKLFLILALLIGGASFSQTKHTFTGTGETEVRLASPGYSALGKYQTWFAAETEVRPGDTLEFIGTFRAVDLYGYSGDVGKRIVITGGGAGGHIRRGIKGYDLRYFEITGRPAGYTSNIPDSTGTQPYTLTFGDGDLRDAAVDIMGRIAYIKVDHIKGYQGAYGCRIKTDPPDEVFHGFCDSNYVHFPGRPGNNIIDSVEINNCRFVDYSQDIYYIGNSFPYGGLYPCGGADKFFTPMHLGNVVIRYNFLSIAGRTACQVAGASEGRQLIYGNVIDNVGDELNQQQGFGIAIGGGTRNCFVFNNRIKRTFQYGIFDIGYDTNYIYNNHVDSSGMLNNSVFTPAFTNAHPTQDRDSTIDAETSVFARDGVYIKNIFLGFNLSFLSKPEPSVGWGDKSIWLLNNYFGKNTGAVYPEGDIGFRQDDGDNVNWGTNSIICGNTNSRGEATHVWTYNVSSVTYPENSSTCPDMSTLPSPENLFPGGEPPIDPPPPFTNPGFKFKALKGKRVKFHLE